MNAAEIFARVEPPSSAARKEAEEFHTTLTKPAGSLGRLEEIGVFVAGCQGQVPPKPIKRARIVIFAGDHGVSQYGVSAFPSEVSLQMAANIESGGAAISVLAESAGASVRVADISLDHDAWGDERVRRSCNAIHVEDAMTEKEVIRALEIGKRIADQEVDGGADLLMAGDLGIGNTTPAAALIGVATRTEPVAVVGRGTGIDDEGWKRKVSVVRDAMFRVRDDRNDPIRVLQAISSPDLAAMAGFLAQASIRRTPVILDGVVVTSAALWATRLAPGARNWWIAGHQSAEPAHKVALQNLELKPLLKYGMRLGEGSGAMTALPLVKASVDIMAHMATFAAAGVSESSSNDSDAASVTATAVSDEDKA